MEPTAKMVIMQHYLKCFINIRSILSILKEVWYIINHILNRLYSKIFFVDIDECASIPCQNGGSCTDQINNYNCHCDDGYDGPNCENGNDALSLKVTVYIKTYIWVFHHQYIL